jgi:DNA repair protein REV1
MSVGDGRFWCRLIICRLHHLSNWKAELKILVAQAQSAAESSETVHNLAPGAKPVGPEDLSFTDTTLPKAQARTTTIIGQKGRPQGDGFKVIFHVDFDAFFVACGLSTRPHLRGKPVVVCHSQGNQGSRADDRNQDADERGKGSTSEIASCSYEARAKGVKNGMSLGQARKLCPEVQTMP